LYHNLIGNTKEMIHISLMYVEKYKKLLDITKINSLNYLFGIYNIILSYLEENDTKTAYHYWQQLKKLKYDEKFPIAKKLMSEAFLFTKIKLAERDFSSESVKEVQSYYLQMKEAEGKLSSIEKLETYIIIAQYFIFSKRYDLSEKCLSGLFGLNISKDESFYLNLARILYIAQLIDKKDWFYVKSNIRNIKRYYKGRDYCMELFILSVFTDLLKAKDASEKQLKSIFSRSNEKYKLLLSNKVEHYKTRYLDFGIWLKINL
jgi:hypothetical protein